MDGFLGVLLFGLGGFRSGLRREVTHDFDIVLLRCARRAAAVRDELLQLRAHCLHSLALLAGEVIRFTDVVGEVVELVDIVIEHELPWSVAQTRCAAAGGADGLDAHGFRRSFEQRQKAEAVFTDVAGELRAEDVGERGDEVSLMHELVARAAGLHHAGPAHDERHAMPALEDGAFVFTQRPARRMVLRFHFVVGVRCAAVVTGEQDKRVVRRAARLQRIEHAAHHGIGFHHKVGVGAEAALATPLGVRRDGRVRCGQRQIKQERLLRLCLPRDKVRRAVAERGQDGFELPIRERRPRDACELPLEQRQRQENRRHPHCAVILDETIRRLVRHIGAKVFVEAACRRSARDGS